MRLHSLELAAIGPYATGQRVDFDRLAASGLFLIEGPTGAGKTTILDAVTFALYGGLAGQGSGRDRLRCDFADPAAEPSARLEFSLRGVRYRVSRVPEHRRPKRRGEGWVTDPARVHLERLDGGRWASLSSSHAEAGERITAAVGLNRDQFTQVVLLPQGEFARFLRADDDERRKVLTRLFGTQLYEAITEELDRRRAEAARAGQAARERVLAAVAAAAEAAGLDAEAGQELARLPGDERAVRFKQIGDELARQAALAREAVGLAAGQAGRAEAAQREAAARAGAMTRLTEALARLAEHEAGRGEHDARSARLEAARRAEPVRPLLALLAEASAKAGRARADVLAAAEAVRGRLGAGPARDALGELIEILGAAADGEGGIAGAAAADEPARLAGETADVKSVTAREATAATGRAEAAEAEAAALEPLVAAESALPGRQAEHAEKERAAAGAERRLAAVTAARRELPGRIAAAGDRLEQARNAAAGLDALLARRSELGRLADAAGRLERIRPELARKDAARQAAIDAYQRLTDLHQQAMDARLAGMAAELAGGLAPGEPCPVCGSPEHPAPARPGARQVTAEEVDAARARRDEAGAARGRAEAEHAALAREAAECAAVTGGRALAELTAEAAEVAGRARQAEEARQEAARLAAELEDLRAEQERLGDDHAAAAAAAAEAAREAERARADLSGLRASLAEAAGPHPSVAARQAALRRDAEAGRALAAALGQLGAALDAARDAELRARDEAQARGFATAGQAGSALLAPGEIARLEDQVTSWATALTELRAAVQAPDLAGLDPAAAAEAHEAARLAVAELARAREAEQEARTAHEALLARAGRLEGRLAELGRAEAEAQAHEAASGPVIHLAQLAKGMAGHRRVALTTYVLRHWFEQVVAAANLRLAVMSSGRYELLRSDQGQNRRERAGLTLSVADRHTGEERGPGSLSGGETFYTSLALALGLADVVKAEAGGVELETLFIDEGFGALDPQTLDQVLTVIDELRDRGRAVGIVSHVPDLKERIAERLEVRRRPDGSSTLRVVA